MLVHTAAFGHESNTFNPLLTKKEDFRIETGSDSGGLFSKDAFAGIIDGLESAGYTPQTSVRARALPGGVVQEKAYEELAGQFLQGAQKTRGACVFCHGAMRSEKRDYADEQSLRRLRNILGPERPLVVAMDMHANLTLDLVEAVDALVCYRTAPHVDTYETGQRAAALFDGIFRDQVRPETAFVRVPLLMPGEMAQSGKEPMRSVLEMAREVESKEGVLSVSLTKSHCWADVPEIGFGVIVTADGDRVKARFAAAQLAREVWRRRAEFRTTVETYAPRESVRVARKASEKTVFLSDAGDNPGAGGTTDVPRLLEELLEQDVPSAFMGAVWDPESVTRCVEAGPGADIHLQVGGKIDTKHGSPLSVKGKVIAVFPHSATFRVGGVDLLITSQRESIVTPPQLRSRGIEPLEYKIVVLKRGYLEPDFEKISPRSILSLTPGCTDCDVTRLAYRRVRRPIFPLDTDFKWEPEN